MKPDTTVIEAKPGEKTEGGRIGVLHPKRPAGKRPLSSQRNKGFSAGEKDSLAATLRHTIVDVFDIKELRDSKHAPQPEQIGPIDLMGEVDPVDYLRGDYCNEKN
ncbi:MAG: hypothetical protein ABIG67_08825 [Pseudomonadota bacterium]